MLRVLRPKFLRALLHNRDRLQPHYCDFSLPGLCCRLENTRHIDREGFEARRSIQLSYRRAVMASTTYEFFGLSVLHTLCIIGKLRKFHALSSFGRREAFVLSNNPLILYTTNVEIVPAEKGVGYLHCGSASTGGDPMISAWSRSRELRRRSWERASAFWASSAWPSFR